MDSSDKFQLTYYISYYNFGKSEIIKRKCNHTYVVKNNLIGLNLTQTIIDKNVINFCRNRCHKIKLVTVFSI